MPIEIPMPRLSDTMEEGTLVKWHVSVGDKVESGAHLADVETDKATMELQAFDDGTVAKLLTDEGGTVAVGDVILVLAEEGEDVETVGKAGSGPKSAEAASAADGGAKKREGSSQSTATEEPEEPDQKETARTDPKSTASSGESGGNGRVRVSPLARKLAEEHDLDLSSIEGTGPDGRIIKRDVLQAVEGGSAQASSADSSQAPTKSSVKTIESGRRDEGDARLTKTPGKLESKTISLSGMRKTIAKRLVESKTTIPHFQTTMAVEMDGLMELRATLNKQLEAQGVKLSVNDFIVRAAALACVEHPIVNSSWAGDSIQQHGTVNIGIAVALPAEKGGGLVVPVIRDAHERGLRSISDRTRQLAKKAREAGLTPDEMGEGTFTISNLGMFGVSQFNAIINPPQAAILAVGGAIEQPIVRNGSIEVGHVMNATLSADHRVIDGAIAAEYLVSFKRLMENPATLLV